jgi:predicted dinucleotide-binding enzyme
MKKIGIIGSGVVAQTLGSGFLNEGHQVMMGSRDISKLEDWKQKNKNGQTGTFEEAATFGDIIVLSVKGSAAGDVVEQAGVQNFNGKTVIDTCNPITDATPENGVLHFFTSLEESLMEQLQERFPAVHFVKAFNSVGNAIMVHPKFAEKPSMFICGNNDAAKKDVAEILVAFGWEVEDMGKVEAARAIEPLCMLWCIPGMLNNQWNHAFRLIKA